MSALPAPYIAFYPATGGYASARSWPAAGYAALAQSDACDGATVVVVGGADATPAARKIVASAPNAVDLTGQTTLAQLVGVVRGAEVVVGGDSFIGHLTAAVGRPQVSIFGPSNVDAWRPYGALDDTRALPGVRQLVTRLDLPCAPCLYTGYALGRPSGCPARTCLTTLAVERVAAAVRQVRRARQES